MTTGVHHTFSIGALQFSHRLIQGPLAGFSCAPFRVLFNAFVPPAYSVSEMISAYDVLYKHQQNSRYVYRAPEEKRLCYQLSGTDPQIMAQAASRLEGIGADLIDINAGCPKTKIRKKGAGSALLNVPEQLCTIVRAVRDAIQIPLTVKVRIQGHAGDIALAKALAQEGADALIIHGRRWMDDYDTPSDFSQIAGIKKAVQIPVIANGDIADANSLNKAIETGCDAFMISRAGTGKPWLYQALLDREGTFCAPGFEARVGYFITHIQGLAKLESEYQAILQSKSLLRYYFKEELSGHRLGGMAQTGSRAQPRERRSLNGPLILEKYYTLTTLAEIERYLLSISPL